MREVSWTYHPLCSTSAPNGDYSTSSLLSVRDEVFISVFDEVLIEVVEVRHTLYRQKFVDT